MIRLRPACAGDLGYVKTTWAKSVRGLLKSGPARDHSRAALEALMDSLFGESLVVEVTIACSSAMESAIAGYAVHRGSTPIYVYVSRECRGQGLGERLLHAIAEKTTS